MPTKKPFSCFRKSYEEGRTDGSYVVRDKIQRGRTALRKGWPLKSKPGEPMSPAQAKQARTREAARGAFEMLRKKRDGKSTGTELIPIAGGCDDAGK